MFPRRWNFRFRIKSLLIVVALAACASLCIRLQMQYANARAELVRIISGTDSTSGKNCAQARRIVKRYPTLAKTRGVTLWAAVHADYETLEVILEYGGNANEPGGIKGGCPLFLAVVRGDVRLAECLLQHGANPFWRSDVEMMPSNLLSVACGSGSLENAKLFLRAGIDVNAAEVGEGVPLHYAAASGNLELVRFLLKNGADTQARDCHGLTPVEYVAVCVNVAAINRDTEREAALCRIRDELIIWEEELRTASTRKD